MQKIRKSVLVFAGAVLVVMMLAVSFMFGINSTLEAKNKASFEIMHIQNHSVNSDVHNKIVNEYKAELADIKDSLTDIANTTSDANTKEKLNKIIDSLN